MLVGPMTLFEKTTKDILEGLVPGYVSQGLSAHLMTQAYTPMAATQKSLADIAPCEVAGQGYAAKPLTGVAVSLGAAKVSLVSDPIIFGAPITLPLFRYLVLATGLPGVGGSTKYLVAYADLLVGGGAREVVRGSLTFNHDEDGWLSFAWA